MQDDQLVSWDSAQIARFWDFQSRRPSANHIYFSTNHGKWIARRSLKFVKSSPPTRVLDLGCGTGHLLRHLAQARAGLVLHGIDQSAKTIEECRNAVRSVTPLPEVDVSTGFPTKFDQGSFDAVYAVEVIEHMMDGVLDPMLKEVHRLLKPGGLLVVTTPNNEDLERMNTCCPACGAVFHMWQHVRNWSVSSLNDFMAERGFQRVVSVETTLDAPTIRLALWLLRKLRLTKRRPPHLFAIYRR